MAGVIASNSGLGLKVPTVPAHIQIGDPISIPSSLTADATVRANSAGYVWTHTAGTSVVIAGTVAVHPL